MKDIYSTIFFWGISVHDGTVIFQNKKITRGIFTIDFYKEFRRRNNMLYLFFLSLTNSILYLYCIGLQ